MTTQAPHSLVMTRIGGRDYPMRSIVGCRTCQSAYRQWIESELLAGRSYAAIVRALANEPERGTAHPSAQGIATHVREKHMPLGLSAQRRIIERRAEQVGKSLEDADADLVDYVTVSQMVVQRGFERLQEGEIQPELADVLAAARVLQQVDKDAQTGIDQQVFQEVLMAYMEVAMQYVAPERRQDMAMALRNHPTLKAFAESQKQTVEGRVLTD